MPHGGLPHHVGNLSADFRTENVNTLSGLPATGLHQAQLVPGISKEARRAVRTESCQSQYLSGAAG
jgi:hypothetical protein